MFYNQLHAVEDCAKLKIYTIEVKARECDAIGRILNITEFMISLKEKSGD